MSFYQCLFLNEVMNAKYGIHVSPNNKTLAVTNKWLKGTYTTKTIHKLINYYIMHSVLIFICRYKLNIC